MMKLETKEALGDKARPAPENNANESVARARRLWRRQRVEEEEGEEEWHMNNGFWGRRRSDAP